MYLRRLENKMNKKDENLTVKSVKGKPSTTEQATKASKRVTTSAKEGDKQKNRTIGPWLIWVDSTMKSGGFHMKYTAYLAFSGRP